MSQEQAVPRHRDARIDQIGFVNELEKHLIAGLKAAVKDKHPEPGTRLEADFFEGLIVGGNKDSIAPAAWFGLFSKKKITLAQFLDAITVSTSKAGEAIDGPTYKRITTTAPTGNKLLVTRIKGVELPLVDAVRRLSQSIETQRLAA